MTACRWTLWRGMCGVLIAYGLGGAASARANVQTAYGNIWYPSVTSTTDAFYIAVASNRVATAAFVVTGEGAVLLDEAPAAGAVVTAGFLFDVPVRFADDRLEVSRATFLAGEIASVPLIEVRAPW